MLGAVRVCDGFDGTSQSVVGLSVMPIERAGSAAAATILVKKAKPTWSCAPTRHGGGRLVGTGEGLRARRGSIAGGLGGYKSATSDLFTDSKGLPK